MKLFRNILVLADDAEAVATLLDTVAEIAGYAQAEVTVGAVVEMRNWIWLIKGNEQALTDLDSALIAARRAQLEEMAKPLEVKGIEARVSPLRGRGPQGDAAGPARIGCRCGRRRSLGARGGGAQRSYPRGGLSAGSGRIP